MRLMQALTEPASALLVNWFPRSNETTEPVMIC